MNQMVDIRPQVQAAVLDSAHLGDIEGALGTIFQHDTGARLTWRRHLVTLLAIIGPGLIVMAGDNDAGAFATYTQAGQNYGTTLLWTLPLLIPVLYVNQEMVLRLGAVTGVGHARLILQRFGKFWGAFSVIDLFLLNALTIVTEFIGISLALDYLGVSKLFGVVIAAVLTIIGATTGNFRRFERFALALCFGSLLLVPILSMAHPPVGQMLHDLVIPGLPAGKLSDIMLLIIGLVGTTVAPWQLFFQQSYVVDKRITPRFMAYERADLWLGILLVMVGGVALMAFAAGAFADTPQFGKFTDVAGVAEGLAQHVGPTAGVLFALALIDASVIGASAVSLSTAYAIGDVLAVNHSLHRKPSEAIGFYLVYAGLIGLAAALVLVPGSPLGLLTLAVQVLAGVLLPSATVFLLLLCNDRAVLGPWVNRTGLNIFTGGVIAVLVVLSVILTAAVLFPDISDRTIIWILAGGMLSALIAGGIALLARRNGRDSGVVGPDEDRETWRMPPLALLAPARLTPAKRIWLGVLRFYLLAAMIMVVVRVAQIALGQG